MTHTDRVDVHVGMAGIDTAKWWVFALLGVVFLAMAAFVFGHLMLASIASALLFGAALAVGGAFQVAHAFWARSWSGFVLSLLFGLLYLVGGVYLMSNPEITSVALTLVIAAMLIASGLFRLLLAYRLWPLGGPMLVLSGLIAVLVGLVIFVKWPASGMIVLGLCLGIDLMFFGLFWLMLGLAMKPARA